MGIQYINNEKCDLVKPSERTSTESEFYWNVWDYDICRKKIKTAENKFEVIIMLCQWSMWEAVVACTQLSDKALKGNWILVTVRNKTNRLQLEIL